LGTLSNLTYLFLSGNPLICIAQSIGFLPNLRYIGLDNMPRLCYPPPDYVNPIDFMKHNKDTESRSGRLEHAWRGVRLMLVSRTTQNGAFAILPVELVQIIRDFIIADPYLETPE